jgi:site-specific DNA-methyltransferase (adenine-specific)
MEVMAKMKDKEFDLAIVDPPYGIKRDVGFVGFGGFGEPIARRQYKGGWDNERPPSKYFQELLRVADKVIIFGGNYFADLLPQGNHWVVWDKQNTMPTFGDAELIWTNIDRNSVKIKVHQWNGLLGKEKQSRIHPTQKPVALYQWLLKNYAKQGDRILDTHGGSCSSAIACDIMGFDAVIFEIDKDYFEAALDRFNRHKQQQVLAL